MVLPFKSQEDAILWPNPTPDEREDVLVRRIASFAVHSELGVDFIQCTTVPDLHDLDCNQSVADVAVFDLVFALGILPVGIHANRDDVALSGEELDRSLRVKRE